MDVTVRAFWLPKAGHTTQEYEDDFDFSYNRAVRGDRDDGPRATVVRRRMAAPRFAIADGATESSFSGLWAHQLVELYVARGPRQPATLQKWVNREASAWFAQVNRRKLPWYAENKAREGAFSTLLGLSLLPDGATERRWTALAVGDSCLFQVRGDELVSSWPAKTADELGYHPVLLSTRTDKNTSVWAQSELLRCDGSWAAGDTLLLMTDALAHWFLCRTEAGERPWEPLFELAEASMLDRDLFRPWIEGLRRFSGLRNDDVTLLIVKPD